MRKVVAAENGLLEARIVRIGEGFFVNAKPRRRRARLRAQERHHDREQSDDRHDRHSPPRDQRQRLPPAGFFATSLLCGDSRANAREEEWSIRCGFNLTSICGSRSQNASAGVIKLLFLFRISLEHGASTSRLAPQGKDDPRAAEVTSCCLAGAQNLPFTGTFALSGANARAHDVPAPSLWKSTNQSSRQFPQRKNLRRPAASAPPGHLH